MIRFIVILLLSASLLLNNASAEETGNLRADIERILLVRGDDLDKRQLLVKYADDSKIDQEKVIKEIEKSVADLLGSHNTNRHDIILLKSGIYVLGKFNQASSLNVIKEATSHSESGVRIIAIISYTDIARENSLDLAKEIIAKPDQFGMMERFVLYERLACYAQKAKDPILDAKRKAVCQFLVDNTQNETSPDAAKKLDELLCGISPAYKVSLQREFAATRFKDEKVPIFRDYFNGVLNELQKVPAGDRADFTKGNTP